MIIRLTPEADERSTYIITVDFIDSDDNAVVPSSASWTLTDATGSVINSRSGVSISPLAATRIVLSGLDLAIQSTTDDRIRLLLIEATYSSDDGSNLPLRAQTSFNINDFV
jgi:hypothetical protein